MDEKPAAPAEDDIAALGIGLRGKRLNELGELPCVCGHGDEHQLKIAVVEADVIGIEAQDAADRDGVADHTVDVFAFKRLAVELEADMVRAQRLQILDARKYIGQMPQHVFKILRRAVGRFDKRAESDDVCEGTPVEVTNIQQLRRSADDVVCRGAQIKGQTEAHAVIVSAARRQIADGLLMAALYHAGNDLAECTVPADAGDQVIILAHIPDELPGVSGFFGQDNRTKVTAALKNLEELGDPFCAFTFSGFGVDDEQQIFVQDRDGYLLSLR